jgi:DNA-binding transcriptional ArsR family regulator
VEVVNDSATSTVGKIDAIRACQDDIGERARAATIGGRDAQLLALHFEQPYCRIANVVERCDVTRQTASSWLHALVDAGLLRDVKVGRDRLFVNHEFLHVLIRTE